jgi:glutamate/tyrosine decarboxylase-like PLP-dependent enzyme
MDMDTSAADHMNIWRLLAEGIEAHLGGADNAATTSPPDEVAVRELIAAFDFHHPLPPGDALALAIHGLRDLQPNNRHPRYFGLFDGVPETMSIVGEALAAAFNCCLATRDGSPFAAAAEEKLVREFGTRLGYPEECVDGIFTSGGSEANLSALLLALTARFPGYRSGGLIAMTQRPMVYVSPEAHPSVLRAVRLSGLGAESVRTVRTDSSLRMNMDALEEMIAVDRRAGLTPLAVMLTAGTTGAGVIDPLENAADIAARHRLWLHVDAAWGGAAAMLPDRDPAFDGLGRADSITFDPHKWLAVPLGVGTMLTRHRGLLERAFSVTATFLDADDSHAEPFARSLRWSRDFAALRVLLSLAVTGWPGLEQSLRRQIRLGDELRRQLTAAGWKVVNDTPLPVVCFVPERPADQLPDRLRPLATIVNTSGDVRIFSVRIGTMHALRASITNPETTDADVSALVGILGQAASQLQCRPG